MSRVLIKPGSTTTEDSQKLKILDLGSRCNIQCRQYKGADQRCCCRAADLRLCFLHMQKANVLMMRLKCTLKKSFQMTCQILSRAKHLVRKRLTSQKLSLAYVICVLSKYVYTLERYTSNFER